MQKATILLLLKIVLWMAGLYTSAAYRFHTIYFVVSGIVFIFSNLGKRKQGSLSAYSVFNQNCQRLHGTMDPFALFGGSKQPKDHQKLVIEHQSTENVLERQNYFKNQSKYGNKPCFCGSTLKFKKCCLVKERQLAEQQRAKRIKGVKSL